MNGKHPNGNPNIKLEVVRDAVVGDYMVADMVQRIVDSDRYDRPCNLVMCNPCPTYITVAHILQRLKVNMRNVKFFMMDEWADEDGNIAPLSYKAASRNDRPAGCHPRGKALAYKDLRVTLVRVCRPHHEAEAWRFLSTKNGIKHTAHPLRCNYSPT